MSALGEAFSVVAVMQNGRLTLIEWLHLFSGALGWRPPPSFSPSPSLVFWTQEVTWQVCEDEFSHRLKTKNTKSVKTDQEALRRHTKQG